MESITNCHQILEHWIMSISQGASVWTVYNFIYFYIFNILLGEFIYFLIF